MPERATEEDRDLLGDLGVDTAPAQRASRTPREERIIAGFEEIERFVDEHGRTPRHGEENDIFERLYAVRLDRIRESSECREVLENLDSKRLLDSAAVGVENQSGVVKEDPGEYRAGSGDSDEALLEDLGVEASVGDKDITNLTHVRSRQEIRAAEEIAQRTPCADFAKFEPTFAAVQKDLETGQRLTRKFKDNAEIKVGDLFILEGQKILVAARGEEFVPDHGRPDRRLRVIFDNGTESDLLLRSLQRALNKDGASRRITDPEFGPLFSNIESDGDVSSGTIYVLRSLSEDPFVAENRQVLHKIGITAGNLKTRIANAKKNTTYLLADVEVVASYKLSNLDPKKLESILHHFFSEARLDLELKDRFGGGVEPREWFLVPLQVIKEAISMLIDGSIERYRFDAKVAKVVERGK